MALDLNPMAAIESIGLDPKAVVEKLDFRPLAEKVDPRAVAAKLDPRAKPAQPAPRRTAEPDTPAPPPHAQGPSAWAPRRADRNRRCCARAPSASERELKPRAG